MANEINGSTGTETGKPSKGVPRNAGGDHHVYLSLLQSNDEALAQKGHVAVGRSVFEFKHQDERCELVLDTTSRRNQNGEDGRVPSGSPRTLATAA